MAFDVASARQEGYSDDEIVSFLAQNHPNFDVQGAIKDGYKLDEIASELNTPRKDPTAIPATKEQPGFFKRAIGQSPLLPILGGTAGAIVGGIPGAALGGASGESYRQLAARSMGMESPSTSVEAAKNIAIEGGVQGTGQAVSAGVGAALPMVGKAIMKTPYIGTGLKATGKFTKDTMGDIFQLITKIKPENAKTLFQNPSAILPGKMKKAQEAWRSAAKDAGLPVDDVSPEIINALKKDARSTVFDTFEKMNAGGAVSAADAQIAKQALDIALMPAAKTERNKPLVALYGKMRQKFTERIGEESPDLAKANKQYAIAKAGSKFKSLFPKNLDNSPAYFRSSVLPTVLTGAGAYRGEPYEGALQGATVATLTSPLAIGSGLAMAGGGKLLLPHVRKAVAASLAEMGKKKLERE